MRKLRQKVGGVFLPALGFFQEGICLCFFKKEKLYGRWRRSGMRTERFHGHIFRIETANCAKGDYQPVVLPIGDNQLVENAYNVSDETIRSLEFTD